MKIKVKILFLLLMILDTFVFSIAILILRMGLKYNKVISTEEFIHIASLSVTEAYRLIQLAELYTKLAWILFSATVIMSIITGGGVLFYRHKREKKVCG